MAFTNNAINNSVTLGTSSSSANPKVAGDATTGLYTPSAHNVGIVGQGTQIVEFDSVASGVNGLILSNAATGGAPSIAAGGPGSDSNINVVLSAKGAGQIIVGSSISSTYNISAGNLSQINSVTYTWPSSQGGTLSVLTNNGSGVLTWASATAGTVVGGTYMGDTVTAAQTITLIEYAPYGFTINSLKNFGTVSGTVNGTLKINGVAVTGISALPGTSSPQNANASGANTVVAGNTVTFVTDTPSSLTGLLPFTILATRT